jgi:hypothetical protein
VSAPNAVPFDWFGDALARYARIAITGYPKTGKTTLSARVGDRPVVHGDDYIPLGWSEASQKMADVVNNTQGPVLVEGVQVPRALRKGMRVDAIIWLDARLVPYDRKHAPMSEGVLTVFTEWRQSNPHVPVLLPAPVPTRNALPKQEFP